MRRPAWILIALLAAPPVRAQTCGGVLDLTFVNPSSARSRPEVHIREIDVRAQFLTASIPAGTSPTAAALAAARSRTAHLPAYGDAYVSGTTLSLAPRCDTDLLHLVLGYHDETMTLDLYHLPSHIPLTFDAPLSLRPGRFVFDFDEMEPRRREDGRHLYPASAVRRAD